MNDNSPHPHVLDPIHAAMDRREFVTAVGAATAGTVAFGLDAPRHARATEATEADQQATARSLIGYSSEISVRPGETVDFMVSSFGGGPFDADLVRVINGDSTSRYADQFRVDPVDAAFAGSYDGIAQELNTGSYVEIDAESSLEDLDSFTVSGWIYPVFNPLEYQEPDLENLDPFSPATLTLGAEVAAQTIVSRLDLAGGPGWTLRIDEEFRLEFAVVDGTRVSSIRLDSEVRTWDWAYVAASFDAATGTGTVHLLERPFAPGDQYTARTLSASGFFDGSLSHDAPLRIAAACDGAGAARSARLKPAEVFNGRIQDVRICNRVLEEAEIGELASEQVPGHLSGVVVADWDFGRGIRTTRIDDISGNGHHGTVVNLAERAVRGRFWKGDTLRWTDDPDQYDAITFYTDDLYDAEWGVGFSYTIPDDLKSGIYAARLRQGDFTEYVTFFVAAPAGRPTADVAVLLSDFNYLAYSNISLIVTAMSNYPGHNPNDYDADFLAQNNSYATGGVYNMHVDGRYFGYGSRLRPDVHLKPGGFMYNFVQDTHITAFLENEGVDYDIITEELLDREGLALLDQYRTVISATHPEYVTLDIFDAVTRYTAEGGRFIYTGGNGWFWSVGTHPELPGVMESRNFHDIGDRYLTNGRRGGLLVEAGRQTGPTFGVEMAAMIFNGSSGYRRLEAASDPRGSWIFEGTSEGVVFGEYGPDRVRGGAAGFEIDRYNPGNGTPRHALHLATSEPLLATVEDVKLSVLPLAISYHPFEGEPWAQSDLVFFETPNGGAVFTAGSNCWISATLEDGFDNDVATITRNVLNRFLDPAPFPPVEVDFQTDRSPDKSAYDRMPSQTEG